MIEAPKVGDASLVYMYGLSDFWVNMFADKELVESILASETVQLAEAYSYFLQRSAGISLTDIQDKYETRIKLLLLGEDDLIDPLDLSEFRLPSNILSTKHLSNRPILPTQTLDDTIHYEMRENTIKFYKPLDELMFPIRYKSDGTWQYAVWMCDVEINDKWIDNSFGRLVGFTEEDAIFNYKSFLEGVYYLYTNGPNLSYIERGVNLAMGMPYARETEDVLAIEQDSLSGNWVVFTPHNSYEIPYAYRPDLIVGDTVTEGNVLSTWVTVNDYNSYERETGSGAWWYQIYLPREVLNLTPDQPTTIIGRASEGSVGDYMMQNFLKHHMFEVLITQPNSDITAFNTARDLVLYSKPEYTFPVFIWKVPLKDELITMDDELGFSYTNNQFNAEYCVPPPSVRYMNRGVEDDDFNRGTNWYNRCQGSMYAASLLGYGDWPDNGGWAPQFDSISTDYEEYMSLLMRTRGDIVSPTNRGTIMRGWRGSVRENYDGITWSIPSDAVYGSEGAYEVNERNLTPLYMMTRNELIEKMRTVSPSFSISGRNKFIVTGLNLPEVYELWMKRNTDVPSSSGSDYTFSFSSGGLDINFSYFAYQTYVPNLSDMYNADGTPFTDGTLMITRSTDSAWVCQWVRNTFAYAPTMFPLEDNDWTRAIESYGFDDIGEADHYESNTFNAGVLRVQTPHPSELAVGGNECFIVVVDGKYVAIDEYSVENENTQAENPSDPDNPIVIPGIISRSFLVLDNPASTRGYITNTPLTDAAFAEERIAGTGTFTLSETVASKEDILVIDDSTREFITDYTVTGDQLVVPLPRTGVIVRYVATRDEEILSAGSSTYTLSSDEHCYLFRDGKIVEEWEFRRDGANIDFGTISTSDIIVRYHDHTDDIKVSPFNRSMVEGNQARFLMDRGREGGEYDDYLGQTVFMNRGGIPTLADGSNADNVQVIRRLI